MQRLSRKEKQAKTRSSLMKSAAKMFCSHAMDRASIDDVAEDAGYTKGAFYASFKNKEELFLAMLDQNCEERIADVERAFATAEESPPDQARHAAADSPARCTPNPSTPVWSRSSTPTRCATTASARSS